MRSNLRRAGGLFVLLLFVLGATTAFGQGIITGSISGIVQDQQKAVIAGATVTAKEVTTNREFTAVTNEVGLFSIRALPIGTYNIAIQAPGFKNYGLKGVTVSAGVNTEIGSQILSNGGTAATSEAKRTALRA